MAGDIGIGKIITTPRQRDAVHIAVAPMVAAELLKPGTHVGVGKDGRATRNMRATRIGIVDPFLTKHVKEGEEFYVCLYPGSVESIRHHWTHPAFVDEDQSTPDPRIASEAWLRQFAEEMETSYPRLMEIAEAANDGTGEWDGNVLHYSGHDTPDRGYNDIQGFWYHWSVVTGKTPSDHTRTFFSCAC